MRLQMRGRQIDWTEALQQHAKRWLHFTLSRFSRKISLVTVHILNVTALPGGFDQTCRIVVNLLPEGRVDIEETRADLYAALGRAAERAGRAVGRALDRKHHWEAGAERSGAGGGATL